MTIEILGDAGSDCKQLEQNMQEALVLLGIAGEIIHVTDADEIREYGVSELPSLVVDGEVLLEGKLASPKEIRTWMVARGHA